MRRLTSALCLTVGGSVGVGCQLLAGFQSFSGGGSDASVADVGVEVGAGEAGDDARADATMGADVAADVGPNDGSADTSSDAGGDASPAGCDGDSATGCEPTTVPEAPSLVLWLDGAQGWDGTTWHDRSGHGRDAKPYTSPVGSTTLNGLTAVSFGGGNLLIDAGFPPWEGATVFAVQWATATNALIAFGVSFNNIGCDLVPPAGAPGCVQYDQLAFGGFGALGLEMCDPSIGNCYKVYDVDPPDAWVRTYMQEIPDTSLGARTWMNGAENVNLGHTPAYPFPAPWNTPRVDTIVAWANYRGSVAELIVFDSVLSDASREAVDAYLANKWNVH